MNWNPIFRASPLVLIASLLGLAALAAAASVGAMNVAPSATRSAAAALKNKETFKDTIGDEQPSPDGKNAPDITGGYIANDDKGNVTVVINIANRSDLLGLNQGDLFAVYIVSKQSTGCDFNTVYALLLSGGGTREFDQCKSGQLVTGSPSLFSASWDSSTQSVVFTTNIDKLFPGTVKSAAAYKLNLFFLTLYTPDNFTTAYFDFSPDQAPPSDFWIYDLTFTKRKISVRMPKPFTTSGGMTRWKSFAIRTSAPQANVIVSSGGRVLEKGKTNKSGSYRSRVLERTFRRGTTFQVSVSKTGYFPCALGARVLTSPPWLALSHSSTCGYVQVG